MTVGATVEAGKLDINRVIQNTIDVLRRRWRSLVRPAFLLLYLPAAVLALLDSTPGPLHAVLSILGLLALIPYTLFLAGLIRLVLADLNAEPASVEDAMTSGRRRLWPLLGINILTALGVALGLVLLIVPGVLLALAWCVAAAVVVEEQGSPAMESFRRSAELTRGSRLNIFGLGLAFVVAEILASLALTIVSLPFPHGFARALLWPVLSAATSVVGGVLIAAIYNELRWLQEDRAAAGSSGAEL